MAFMQWSEQLVTGIEIVDRQHRGLVDLVNEAAPLLAQASGEHVAGPAPLLARLFDYAATHFRTEEDLMAARLVDARVLDHHRRSHARFVEQVGAMAKSYSENAGVTGDQLLSFLAGWLIFHILGEDQTMARQLRAIEAGADSGRAYVEAGGYRIDPDSAALTRILVDLYTQLTRQNRELTLFNEQLQASRGELERHRDRLEDMVRERTAQLEALAEDLRQSRDAAEAGSRAKSRFLGAISHELRTPMNAIVGSAELLCAGGLTAEQQELARHIVDGSGQLMDLIDRIVEFARDEKGEATPQVAPFALAELVEDATRKSFALARAKGLAVSVEIDPGLPGALLGDVGRILAILRQLTGNAVKFTEKGSVRLLAQRGESSADGRVPVRFTVQDSGIGIPADRQQAIFKAFTQADDGLARKFGGTGLGLALARQAAHLMGGEIGLESELGKGSRFWLDVPLAEADPAKIAAASATREQQFSVPVPAAPVDAEPAAVEPEQALAVLEEMLRQDDTRAAGVLRAVLPHLRQRFGEGVGKLTEHVATFEYDRALATLQGLLRAAPRSASSESPESMP